MNTKKLYLKRNITKKSYTYFKNNLHLYLKPEEQNKLIETNDVYKYTKYPKRNIKFKSSITSNKDTVLTFINKIKKYYYNKDTIDIYDLKIHKYFNKFDNYPNYYIINNCVKNNVLNVNTLSHKFTYFNMSNYQINPSNTHILFAIDFIGNRIYHLFIKSLYSNEIKELKIPAQPLININNIYGSNLSDYFIWVNDIEIAYISQNMYYNLGGIYVYNILNKSKYLIKKIPHGYFGNINITTDNHYIVVYISTYSADSIYIMNNDDSKIKLLDKPILDFKDNVTYLSIDHCDGEWIICEKNNNFNYIKKTNDFKHYDILYKNDNPYENIHKMIYLEKKFLFTLTHLKGISLYELSSCKKIKLIYNEPIGYIGIKNKYNTLNNFKFSINHYLLKPQFFLLNHTCIIHKPKYYEKKIYIKKDLFFTILSKEKPHLSKCILWGYGSYNVYENYITIRGGAKDGVKPDMAVINSLGIIGIVDNTSEKYATVVSILNRKSQINAKIKKTNHFF
jgi:protease II